MKNGIPSIKKELDFLDNNKHEIYCVSDWVQTPIEGKMTPVRIKAIHHDGIIVSNSSDIEYTVLGVKKILENLYTLLSKTKDNYSTKSALCIQYAVALIELDNAIVRLSIDKNILKDAVISIKGKWHVDYKKWANLIKEAGKNWGYKDFKETDDVCYFYPGFEYKQFIEEHENYWEALHHKLDAVVKILEELDSYVNQGQISQKEHVATINNLENKEITPLYISYSWSNSDKIDNLCQELQKANISFNRDIIDCGYRDNIRHFEEEIGKGAKVLAFISEEYMKSINCMYELALVFMHGNVEKRLFPIVTKNNCRDAASSKELHDYWELVYQEKRRVLNELPSGASLQAIKEFSYCDHIIRELPRIVNYLSDVNTLTIDQLSKDHFKILIETIASGDRLME